MFCWLTPSCSAILPINIRVLLNGYLKLSSTALSMAFLAVGEGPNGFSFAFNLALSSGGFIAATSACERNSDSCSNEFIFLIIGAATSLLAVPERKASPPAIMALDLIQFLRLSEFDISFKVLVSCFYINKTLKDMSNSLNRRN